MKDSYENENGYVCKMCGINFAEDLEEFQHHQVQKMCHKTNKERVIKKNGILGEFTMVSQPIRLILVDWFVFHFIFLGRLPFLFFLGRLPFFLLLFF